MTTILLLICSNIFMTLAWYGHLKFPHLPMLAAIRTTPQASDDEHAAHGSWRHVLPQMPALVIGTGFFALFDTIALSLLPLFAMSHDDGNFF